MWPNNFEMNLNEIYWNSQIKNKSNKTIELVEHREKLKNLEQQKVELKIYDIKEKKKFSKKKGYKKKFYKKTK